MADARCGDVATLVIVGIDVSAAERLPGVHAVLTGKDAAGLKFGFVRDNVPLKEKVLCEHDEIAAVAADTEEIALKALELIKVEYEDLPAVFSPEAGREASAPQLRENFPDNKSLRFEFKHGDLATARRHPTSSPTTSFARITSRTAAWAPRVPSPISTTMAS